MDQYFDKIKAFILEHGKLEYTSANGEKQLLENGLFVTSYNYGTPIEEHYPFPELWEEVYDTIIRDPVQLKMWNPIARLRKLFSAKPIRAITTMIPNSWEVMEGIAFTRRSWTSSPA